MRLTRRQWEDSKEQQVHKLSKAERKKEKESLPPTEKLAKHRSIRARNLIQLIEGVEKDDPSGISMRVLERFGLFSRQGFTDTAKQVVKSLENNEYIQRRVAQRRGK